jgi:hypothetical protein
MRKTRRQMTAPTMSKIISRKGPFNLMHIHTSDGANTIHLLQRTSRRTTGKPMAMQRQYIHMVEAEQLDDRRAV